MKTLRSIVFALAVLAMATAAHAQQTALKANVPFDFVVGSRTYSAGEYTLKPIGSTDSMLRIDNTQDGFAGMALSNSCAQITPATSSKLVFHRVGDNYFLYQVWVEGNSTGREFPRSRTEIQISQNREKPELVIVAANISR